MLVTKRCGSCGGPVSISSVVGDRCPQCRVVCWGTERTSGYSTGSGGSAGSSGSPAPELTNAQAAVAGGILALLTLAAVLSGIDTWPFHKR